MVVDPAVVDMAVDRFAAATSSMLPGLLKAALDDTFPQWRIGGKELEGVLQGVVDDFIQRQRTKPDLPVELILKIIGMVKPKPGLSKRITQRTLCRLLLISPFLIVDVHRLHRTASEDYMFYLSLRLLNMWKDGSWRARDEMSKSIGLKVARYMDLRHDQEFTLASADAFSALLSFCPSLYWLHLEDPPARWLAQLSGTLANLRILEIERVSNARGLTFLAIPDLSSLIHLEVIRISLNDRCIFHLSPDFGWSSAVKYLRIDGVVGSQSDLKLEQCPELLWLDVPAGALSATWDLPNPTRLSRLEVRSGTVAPNPTSSSSIFLTPNISLLRFETNIRLPNFSPQAPVPLAVRYLDLSKSVFAPSDYDSRMFPLLERLCLDGIESTAWRGCLAQVARQLRAESLLFFSITRAGLEDNGLIDFSLQEGWKEGKSGMIDLSFNRALSAACLVHMMGPGGASTGSLSSRQAVVLLAGQTGIVLAREDLPGMALGTMKDLCDALRVSSLFDLSTAEELEKFLANPMSACEPFALNRLHAYSRQELFDIIGEL